MSVTALFFAFLFIIGLTLTLRNPAFGVLTYIFEWHNHPQYNWWGSSLPDIRYSFIIALITLVSAFFNRNRLKRLPSLGMSPLIWLVVMTVWMYAVSYGWAILPEESLRKSEEFLKITILFFLIVFVLRERVHYNWFIWTLLLFVANFGRIAFERGKNRFVGVKAPNALDENAIAAYVVSTIPFFGVKFIEGTRKVKIFIIIAIPFLVNLLILANSRGALVALIGMAIYALIIFPIRDKFKVIGGLVFGLILLLNLANEQFWKRQKTIENYQKEESAMSRFYLWNAALKMINDYPEGIGGEGPEVLMVDYLAKDPNAKEEFLYESTHGGKTVHNTFLLAGTEWGLPGFFLFVGFLVHIFLILNGLRSRIKGFPDIYRIYYYEIISLQLAIFSLLVAGIFINRFYAESLYWYGALALVLRNVINGEIYVKFASESEEIEMPQVDKLTNSKPLAGR